MPKISVTLYDRSYAIHCPDGQEARLLDITRRVDETVRALIPKVGNTTDTRIFLLACLHLADRVIELETQWRASMAQSDQDTAAIEAYIHTLQERVAHLNTLTLAQDACTFSE